VGWNLNRRRRLPIALLGIAASVLLHGLLLVPLMSGASARKQDLRASPESMALIFVEAESTGPALEDSIDAPDLRLAATSPPPAAVAVGEIAFPSAIGGDDGTTGPAASEASAADPGQVAMFGRYLGQIDARVQRAWIRPRTSIPSSLFECRVRITQDHSGQVLEIELVRCNGDISWQTSLVHAIQGASPLPVPPDPSVFSAKLTLEFRSQPFSVGMRSDGFEREGGGR